MFLPVVPVFEKRMKLLELYINIEYIYIFSVIDEQFQF